MITLVQQDNETHAPGSGSSITATLATPATAGNLLVWVIAGESAPGPPSGFIDRVNTTHLMIATAVAAGGETTVTQAVTSAHDLGVVLYEFNAPFGWDLAGLFSTSSGTGTTATSPSFAPSAYPALGISAWGLAPGSSGFAVFSPFPDDFWSTGVVDWEEVAAGNAGGGSVTWISSVAWNVATLTLQPSVGETIIGELSGS